MSGASLNGRATWSLVIDLAIAVVAILATCILLMII